FALSGNWAGGDATKDVRVGVNGDNHDFSIAQPATWSAANMMWSDRSFTFTADSASTTLSFLSLDAESPYGATISDVRVMAIPEAVSAILRADASLSYDAATGKFYKAVNTPADVATATSNAIADELNSVPGQLVTIRSEYENNLVRELTDYSSQSYYTGGTDVTTEGEWNWIENGAEADRFWNGNVGGSAPAGAYANFVGEPGGGASENYVMIRPSDGIWLDISGLGSNRYVIEWDAAAVLSAHTYALLDDANGRFTIDPVSGALSVAEGMLLDFETASTHNVTIEVTNAAGGTYNEVVAVSVDNAIEAVHIVPASQTIDEDTTLTFTSGTATEVSVTDTLAVTDSLMRVDLSVNDGVLALAQTTGLTFITGSNNSSALLIEGTESAINAALDGIVFTPDAHFNGLVTLNVATSLNAGLEGHYNFVNGNTNDQSGLANNGVLNGSATTIVDPERGEVLSLSAAGDFVEIAGQYGNSSNVTTAAWVNLTSADTAGANLISLSDSTAIRLDVPGQGLVLSYWNGTIFQELAVDVTLAGSGWNHVAAVIDDPGNLQQIYLNGNLIAQGTDSSALVYRTTSDVTRIGTHGDASADRDLTGLIDDARVFTRALSADEISALAANQRLAIGPELTQTFGVTAGDTTGQHHLFIHSGFESINQAGIISALQLAPDSNSTPINFDFLVLRPNGGNYDVVSRTSVSDADVVATDGNGVRTLDIGNIDVLPGDIIAHWSPVDGGSIPYSDSTGGSTAWSVYSTSTDLDVGSTVQESLDTGSTPNRVYGLNVVFSGSDTQADA
ncbi:MAG: LamG-like jellyroll fold domain-containing protein, partial [Pseudomonadota bacterium]